MALDEYDRGFRQERGRHAMMKLILWMVAPAVACELGLALWRGLRRRDDRRYVWASALLRTFVYSPTILGQGFLGVPLPLIGMVLGCLLTWNSWENTVVHLFCGIPELTVFAVAFAVADLRRQRIDSAPPCAG
jgi:hypothetical protein